MVGMDFKIIIIKINKFFIYNNWWLNKNNNINIFSLIIYRYLKIMKKKYFLINWEYKN